MKFLSLPYSEFEKKMTADALEPMISDEFNEMID